MAKANVALEAENRLLRRIIEVTSPDHDVSDVVGQVAALVTEATGSDVCFVHLVNEEGDRVVLAGATPPFDELVGTIELAIGEGVAGWVARHARPAVVPDKWADDRYRYIPALRGEDYASMASVPMRIRGGGVVGVLNVHSRLPRRYDEHNLVLLEQVADLVARAIEKARLYERVAQREEMLEGVAVRALEAQELERRRLAGEIHDGISQPLISLWYRLLAAEDAADDAGDPGAVRRELAAAKQLATAALEEARTAITGLRPSVLDDLGLGPSLESVARSSGDFDLDLDVDLGGERFPAHVEVALYRIAQEALQNVVKHSGAGHVVVRLQATDGEARLSVVDDGRGFTPDSPPDPRARAAYGLVGMRERADLIGAHLTVTSRPGEGTAVEVVVAT